MSKYIPSEQFLSSGDYLAVVRDFALSKGVSLSTLLHDSELSPEEFINPPKLVNNFIVTKIGINLYNELTNPLADAADFGLCMTASSHGSLGIAVQCASNLEEAYEILTRFYNTRINSQNIHSVSESKALKLNLVNKYEMTEEKDLQRFYDLATLISIATNTYKALDKKGLSGSIRIHVDAPEPETFPHEALCGTNVIFDQHELAMFIPNNWKSARLSISNPDISRAAVEQCQDEMKLLSPADFVVKVKQRIEAAGDKIPTLDDLSKEFFVSPATFKRKLKEKATSYQELKDEVRLLEAKKLIRKSTLSIEDIAGKLGYSDASNFTKAFKNWMGQTPKSFRDSHN